MANTLFFCVFLTTFWVDIGQSRDGDHEEVLVENGPHVADQVRELVAVFLLLFVHDRVFHEGADAEDVRDFVPEALGRFLVDFRRDCGELPRQVEAIEAVFLQKLDGVVCEFCTLLARLQLY